jgi:topoisomerase IV subunit B
VIARPADKATQHQTLLKVVIADDDKQDTEDLIERLMGKKPELRFQYIQEHAQFAKDIDV